VVGNLPYNISTPSCSTCWTMCGVIEDQHFMLQKEVIDRMVAAPPPATTGRLSVMLQWRYAMDNVLFVPPESFDPPPGWTARWCAWCRWPTARHGRRAGHLLSEMVQVAFSQRRKLLRHTLGKWLEQRGLLARFDVQRRAEEVPVHEYMCAGAGCGKG
jgi:16S rRNA (adenine1518-N6/adenine1519-N6)-dimethyltransferase